MSSRFAATCRTIFVFTALLLECPFARAEIVTLRNGQKLEGRLGRIHSLADDPYNPSGGGGEIKVKQIVFLDDDLRRTYFSSKQIQPPLAESGLVGERIAIPYTRWTTLLG